MKGNMKKKLLSIVTAAMMIVMLAIPVKAAESTYTGISIDSKNFPSISKVLDMPADSNVPNCGFALSILPGTAMEASTGYLAVKAGPTATNNEVTYPKIADITFVANEEKDATTNPLATKGTSITKSATVDFSHVIFNEPGVYRYVITESAAANYLNIGVGPDEYNERILDVYINDVNGSLTFGGCVITKKKTSDAATAPSATATTVSNKSSSFVNKYPTNTLKINKTVTGNQGSKDEYFKFTIKLENTTDITIDDSLTFGITGQTLEPTQTAATPAEYTSEIMKDANNISTLTGAQLKAGYDIYLQHGDEVTISGLVKNCKFNISEESNGYTVTTVVKQEGESDVSGDSHIVTDTLDNSTVVEYTNNKTGVIPTGVLLSATGLIVVGLIVVIGVVFFGIRSKKRYEED